MKKNAKRRRTKEQVIKDKENSRRYEEMVQAKLAKYDKLEDEFRSLANKVQQEDLIQAQVNSLFQAGILDVDKEGNLKVAQTMSLEEFQDCDKEIEDQENDSRRKRTRYNQFDD